MKKTAVVIAVLFVSLISSAAMADRSTDTFQVTATVIDTCRIVSTDNVDFGNYDPTDPADNNAGQGFGILSCTKGTSYGTYIVRTNTMTDGTNSLAYELYNDPGRSSVYPNAPAGTPGTAASSTPITADIYGKIIAQQNAEPGSYYETVTFTVEY